MMAKRILVIAGSDSSGGAGLEADQKVIAAHCCYAMTATTALTAQNTTGVNGILQTPPEFVRKQIDACVVDIGIDVVKIGMLASAETIRVVADALRVHGLPACVVDPVMVSKSGVQLLPKDAVQALREELLKFTTVFTPNIPEAKLLLEDAGQTVADPNSLEDIVDIAKRVHALGPRYALVKGGHLPLSKDRLDSSREYGKQVVVNVLYGNGGSFFVETDYINTRNTHGTGCSLASAIACNLACGQDVPYAVRTASRYVAAAIRMSGDLGKGNGPINHFHSTYSLPFALGDFVDYLLNRCDVRGVWKEYTEHQFVNRLADGTLPIDAFKCYLIQDYLFLIQFARANALASYKAKSMSDITKSANIVNHIQREMALHISYCEEFGLSEREILSYQESQACTAYTRYVLDVGQSEDWFALQIAIAPCLLGYGFIGTRLFADPKTAREGNRYWKWIESYAADDFQGPTRAYREALEQHAAKQSPSRIEELVKIFIHATRLEAAFWNMGQEMEEMK